MRQLYDVACSLCMLLRFLFFFFFSSRRRHTRSDRDWSSDVCSSDLFQRGFYEVILTTQACIQTIVNAFEIGGDLHVQRGARSEERRVGEEGRSRWSPYH